MALLSRIFGDSMIHLRNLDIDDLLILQNLLTDISLTAIAKSLHISQPAVTQRIRKMESAFNATLLKKKGFRVFLTQEGRSIAEKARQSLSILDGEVNSDPFITIGTREFSAKNILWPTLKEVLKIQSLPKFHISVRGSEELERALEKTEIDCILTSSPKAFGDYSVFHIFEEEYCLIGHVELQHRWDEKFELTLLELNKSLPFLHYLNPDLKASLHFKDHIYLGSIEIILKAAAEKMGFAIVPQCVAEEFIEKYPCKIYLDSQSFHKDEFKLVLPKNSIHMSYIKNIAHLIRKTRTTLIH